MSRWIKVAIVVLLMLAAVVAWSQQTIYTNQVTIEWDAVAPIEPDDVIAYEIFRSPYPITVDRQDPLLHESLGQVSPTNAVISFTVEGSYVLGVRTIRELQGGDIVFSEINWSDENGVATPVPFVIRYLRAISAPVGLRHQ